MIEYHCAPVLNSFCVSIFFSCAFEGLENIYHDMPLHSFAHTAPHPPCKYITSPQKVEMTIFNSSFLPINMFSQK